MKMLFKGNSSRLELLIEKIQSTRETSDLKEIDSIPGSSKDQNTPGPSQMHDNNLASETDDCSVQIDDFNDDTSFSCSICNENFTKGKDLLEHEQIHSDHLQFTCLYCPRLFKHKRSRDRHTKLHTGDKKYKCVHCESAFSRSDHLKIHMRTHDGRKPYKCNICNRGYNTATALASHQQNHLKKECKSDSPTSEDTTDLGDLMRCHFCTSTFNRLEQLQNHIIIEHSNTNSPTGSQSSSDQVNSDSQIYEDLKTVCIYCSKEFHTIDSMYEHINETHNGNNKRSNNDLLSPKIEKNDADIALFPCDRCTMEFDKLDHLKEHICNEHWRPIIFNTKEQNTPFDLSNATDLSKKKKPYDDNDENKLMKRHKTNHSFDANEKPFICSCCYVQLPNFKSFLLHMETHMASSSNLFLGFCVFCGESNRDQISFTNHMFGHVISQLPEHYCCCICEKTFDHCDKLQKHLIDEHVLTVYKCNMCSETFDTKLLMKLHLNNKHSNECQHFKCHLCTDQVFHNKLSAEIHISMKHYHQFASCVLSNQSLMDQVHQDDFEANTKLYGILFNCNYCTKSFKDQFSHYMHLIKDHNGKEQQAPKATSSPPLKTVYQNATANSTETPTDACMLAATPEKIQKTTKGSLSLQCAYCYEYCKSKHDLQVHVKNHHVNCGKIKHKCNICDEIYTSAMSLADHKLKHCKIVDGNNCIQCKSILTDEQTFYTHQIKHSNGLVKTNSQILLPAICIICSQTLQTDIEIKLHAKFHLKHLLEKDFHCKNCKKKIFDKHSDNVQSLCKECVSKNANETEKLSKYNCVKYLKDDERNAMQECNENECHLCKQFFCSSDKLQIHLIEHNFYGINQYSCYVCSSVFTGASGLQNHMLEHNLETKPYECSACRMSFFFRAELDNHRFVHTIKQAQSTTTTTTATLNLLKIENRSEFEYKTCKYCSNLYLNNGFFADHLQQCPYKMSPKREQCDLDNNISKSNEKRVFHSDGDIKQQI